MKSILKKAAGLAVAAVLAWGMTGCANDTDSHEHTFATEWTSDATHHWHAATCEHTAEVKDKAEHSFGDYVSNNDATTEADGTKTRTCSVCGYADTVTDEGSKIEIVATPVFNVASGEVTSGTTVTITCATEDAKIYYTTDGSAPTAASTEYIAAISVTGELKDVVTIKAIAVNSGMNDSAVASVSYTIVSPYALCEVGDYILKDGTVLDKDSTPESGTVAAVIVRAAADGKPALGVGIVLNKGGMEWCKQYTDSTNSTNVVGYITNITALKGTTTSGYVDGSDGWEILKAACSDAEEHPEYYPAWNYSLTYAAKNGLTGDLANGWYLPTGAELYTIYQNKTAIDTSLSKVGGKQFGTSPFWSCCQPPSGNDLAQVLYFKDGTLNRNKNFVYNYVCSVRAFN